MNFLFKNKSKTPIEAVKTIKDLIPKLSSDEKYCNELSKNLNILKTALVGDSEKEITQESLAQISNEIYNYNLFNLILINLVHLDFEARKDFVQIFNIILKRKVGSRLPTVEYLAHNENIILNLFKGYENSEIALNCGMILRECLKFDSLTSIFLNNEKFFKIFDYVEIPTFDISSDAYTTFRESLTRHKEIVSKFLESNYDKFFVNYTKLLKSDNYVTKRQSLKLLNEILLDRAHFNIMTKYISNGENLKLIMNLLKDKSRNIQFEAFHVFKVFVANPNKEKSVLDILKKNQEKLFIHLKDFHNDRQDDQQFCDEKSFLLKQVQKL